MKQLPLFTRRTWLATFLLVAVLALNPPLAGAADETPQQVVAAFMDALKARNLALALKVAGAPLPDDVAAIVEHLGEEAPSITLALKEYTIKDVRTEGGLARVTVEEVRFFDADADARRQVSEKLGPAADALRWGDTRITETFVLVKLGGRWQFDAAHSGVALQAFPMKLLMDALGGDARLERQDLDQVVQFINQAGLGQVVQSLAGVGAYGTVATAFLAPRVAQARAARLLANCSSNLKNMATALEMYSTDNEGHFPPRLQNLQPRYLSLIPTCPAASRDTYSESFTSSVNPDVYTVMCTGTHHASMDLQPNFPLYSSRVGLVRDPSEIPVPALTALAAAVSGDGKLAAGRLDEAIAEYTRAIEIDPGCRNAYEGRGEAWRQKSEWDRCIEDCTKAIGLGSAYGNPWFCRAQARSEKRYYDGAIADFTEAIRRKTRVAEAYLYRGWARSQKDDDQGALADTNKAISLSPRWASAYNNRCVVRRALGDEKGAIADATRAIHLGMDKGEESWPFLNRGNAKKALGDLQGALADYNRAARLDPKDPYNWSARGWTRLLLLAPRKLVLDDLAQAVRLDAKFDSPHFFRGYIWTTENRWKAAHEEFSKALALTKNPKNQRACRYRVWMYLAQAHLGRRDAAAQELSRFLATVPRDSSWSVSLVSFMQGSLSEQGLFARARAGRPHEVRNQRAQALFYAAQRRLLDGDRSGARRYLREIRRGSSRADEYHFAREVLKSL